jgi:hypothetical protein
LLVVEQVLEIIFTFFTLKVDWDPEEEEPAPVALEPLLLPDELPMLPLELGELPVLPLLELGELPMLPLLEPEAEPLLSVPIMRTWWPTWLLSFEVSPASCHVFPDWSVNDQLPAEPLRQPSMELLLLSLEVWVVWVVLVWVVVELVSGLVDWPDEVEDGDDVDWPDEVDEGDADDGEVDDGDVDCCELVSGVVDGDELLGEVCATAQTADNNRIAVIKDVFLMYVPPGF